jgi:hypothetical protein
LPRSGYTTITLNIEMYNKVKELLDKINEQAGYKKFRSVSHFVEHCIAQYQENPELVPLEHFNLGEDGVKILDRSSGKLKVVDVYFKAQKAYCDTCGSSTCRHVKFALSLPEVQQILHKKGWKIEA